MNVQVEDISSIKKKISVEIPVEEVSKEIESFYGELKKKAKIKGFRPGKVPREILERYFKDYVKAEVVQKLIQNTYSEVISEGHLQPVSPPVIDPGELEKDKPFHYTVTVEVKPEIKVEGYLGLQIKGKKDEVKDEEVEEKLKDLQNLHAILKTIPEPRPIQKGDFVLLDYEAWMEGKALEEGRAVDYTIEVGSGLFIPDFEEALVGMKPEEEREIEVSFPEDYNYKKWAGKKVSFHVKIKEIKEKILPPLDEEFAKDFGDYTSIEAFKKKLREEIEKEKESLFKKNLKEQIIERLLEAHSFEVPESLVKAQAKALFSDMKLRLATQGVSLKDFDLSEEKLEHDYHELARKQVRTYLILEKIASQEGIEVTDEEVNERLKNISNRTHQSLETVKGFYERKKLLPELKAEILNEKTLNFLLEKAQIQYS
ncbi:MAG: trigger factor [Thermodesulfobacteriota bacterium]